MNRKPQHKAVEPNCEQLTQRLLTELPNLSEEKCREILSLALARIEFEKQVSTAAYNPQLCRELIALGQEYYRYLVTDWRDWQPKAA
jgi:hypothetical protein